VLEHPVDGPTLAVLTNEDFQVLGLELPGMRRRLRAEVELFLELGCPMAAEVGRWGSDRLESSTQGCLLCSCIQVGASPDSRTPPYCQIFKNINR
jgi:hypothetical protein